MHPCSPRGRCWLGPRRRARRPDQMARRLLYEPLGSDLVMLGKWQRILIDAFDESEAVGVQASVDRHRGRQATGPELSRARRAGHILADRGLVETVLVFGQRTNSGRSVTFSDVVIGDTLSASCHLRPSESNRDAGVLPTS